MNYIIDFKNALLKRISADKIKCEFFDQNTLTHNPILSNINIPPNINSYINSYQPVIIKNNERVIELLHSSKFEMFENRFLMFSKINNIEIICFDTFNINFAHEWDIVNYSNKFVITKTISSFITNKIWAWIDRGRVIWDVENYS